MRRLLTGAVVAGALSALSASPAFATGKNPSTSCGIGGAVSEATQEVGGLGRYFKEVEAGNVGEALQLFHEQVKETC